MTIVLGPVKIVPSKMGLPARRKKTLGRFARLYDRRLPTIRSRDARTAKALLQHVAQLSRFGGISLAFSRTSQEPFRYLSSVQSLFALIDLRIFGQS